jgi:hypothetical protein
MITPKGLVIPLLAFLCVIALLFIGPIPQNLAYHDFADQRTFFGISNFLNVITNLPFGIIGIIGLSLIKDIKNNELKWIAIILFSNFLVLMLGSGYYHLQPNNTTLILDRIPISIIIMSFVALNIFAVRRGKGYLTLIALNLAGILSTIYWAVTEYYGAGDLRWYALVQFFPIIVIPLICYLYKPPTNPTKEITLIILFFCLAKVTEKYDEEIFYFLHNIISGHSLKHLFISVAGFEIIRLTRKTIKAIKS